MKADETPFLKLLEGRKQFIIPIYQRTYSWTLKHCRQLWRDIVRVATNESVSRHFIGSIVYVEKGLYHATTIPRLLVVDGQQRLATLSLLLAALGRSIDQSQVDADVTRGEINDEYLFNKHGKGDLSYKLLLTRSDKHTLIRLLEGKDLPDVVSKRIVENYRFFEEQIGKSGIDPVNLYQGIRKLIIVDISLDREHDNPQLIYESLNSTGLELSQADQIRNYILMGLEPKQQETLYDDYWYPMEQSFGQTDKVALFDRFMRDYLTVKTGRIPNMREVYEAFKVHAQGSKSGSIEEIVADICKYSKYFVRMALEKEEDTDLREAFREINTLKVDVAYPFLLEVYDDYSQQRLNRDQLINILRVMEIYVFRRAICGIPTNSLNKTFATLSRYVRKDRYMESLMAALMLMESNRRFPDDDEFTRELALKDVYDFRICNYCLSKLENHGRKERVNVDDYTIEHVMPQNENLSLTWRNELGANWKEIHTRYLHTLGNLTLTGYNPELSDHPFIEKRDMEGGFGDSPMRLNRDLAKLEHWNEEEIKERGRRLARLATEVWPYPPVAAEVVERYRKIEKPKKHKDYTLGDHTSLAGPVGDLFNQLRVRILSLDASVTENIRKRYIGYRAKRDFAYVAPQKRRLLLKLTIASGEMDDPKGLCKDVVSEHSRGNPRVRVQLTSPEQIDDVMDLVRQCFEKYMESGHQ